MKIEIDTLLQAMNDIEKDLPICTEYESDARHTWPNRWEVLFAKFHDIEKAENIKKAENMSNCDNRNSFEDNPPITQIAEF